MQLCLLISGSLSERQMGQGLTGTSLGQAGGSAVITKWRVTRMARTFTIRDFTMRDNAHFWTPAYLGDLLNPQLLKLNIFVNYLRFDVIDLKHKIYTSLLFHLFS